MPQDFKGALIGPQFLGELKQTIARVNGTPYGGAITRIPTRFEDGGSSSPKTFRICTFTGAWAIGSNKTVTFRGVTTTPNTISATNLFFDLPNNGTSTCAIAKDGTAWYLVQDVHTTVNVLTNVALESSGLKFTVTQIAVVYTATASPVSIGTTSCA